LLRKLLEQPPASLLVHPQNVDLLVLDEAKVGFRGVEGVAGVVVVVPAVEVVVEVVDVVVLVDVDDGLRLHLVDPGHRRLLRQLRTLVALLTRIETRALVPAETVVAGAFPVPGSLRDRVVDRRDPARLPAVALDDDMFEVRRDSAVDLPFRRLGRNVVVAKLPLRRQAQRGCRLHHGVDLQLWLNLFPRLALVLLALEDAQLVGGFECRA
jgi:hypothetical protein